MVGNQRKKVIIYTDGACLGNPGPGGWSAILTYGAVEKVLSGGERQTTNNRMELKAIIEAFKALKEPCTVEIVSDSRYIVDAFQKSWLSQWQARGWHKADKSPVKNQDLWEELLCLTGSHEVLFTHVRGHSGHRYNERCDKLAQDAARALEESGEKKSDEINGITV
ncbi:MAG: ribonuclease HI [Candidatus Eremiobacteraeota bacterium]|nr:ribonuclease HI [Candidatus Eremiobacteraeota bacterium]